MFHIIKTILNLFCNFGNRVVRILNRNIKDMKNLSIFDAKKECWEFNAIGTGIIFVYQVKAKQAILLSAENGAIIEVMDAEFTTPEKFKEEVKKVYMDIVEFSGSSLDFNHQRGARILEGTMEVNLTLLSN